MRLSKHQREALEAVRDGRVEYGSVYPEADKRAWARDGFVGLASFLVDGNEPYGQDKQTLPSLEERGLIRTRWDDVPKVHVPERTRRRPSVAGNGEEYVLPAHDRPEPWGRAPVVLTAAGRAALGEGE